MAAAVRKAWPGRVELLAQSVRRAAKEFKVRLDLRVLRAPKAHQVHKAIQVCQVPRVLADRQESRTHELSLERSASTAVARLVGPRVVVQVKWLLAVA